MSLNNQSNNSTKPFIQALQGQVLPRAPFWFMRQAGRYLPEYKELRKDAGSFLDLCFNPEWAVEVTLQPLRRYDMDAAILFSDILVVPYALGQNLDFITGEGPKLFPQISKDNLETLNKDHFHEKLEKVYETVKGIKEKLDPEKALIGFAGSPWTVATYMVEGGSSRDFATIRLWALEDPTSFKKLIDLLVEVTSEYLIKQIKYGADAVQLFDSWSGILSEKEFTNWVINPTKEIVKNIWDHYPDTPIIGFPRGAGSSYISYTEKTGVTAVGLDQFTSPKWAAENLNIPVQGNLDPMLLIIGGAQMLDEVCFIKESFSGKPFIFNLGHGIMQQTPPEHVLELSLFLKNG